MKALFLITVCIIAFSAALFSQPSHPMQRDTLMKFKQGKPGPLSLINPFNKGKLNVPFSTNNRLFNDPKDKEMKIGKPAPDNLMVQGGIPIIKPEGSFPMPIYKPDSTIYFTMPIKEYKRIPPIDFK